MIFEKSRFVNEEVDYFDGEFLYLPLVRERKKFNFEGAKTYVFQEGDSIDSIALREYDDCLYFWCILDANPQYLSELDVKVGDILIIPSFDEVVDSEEVEEYDE